MYKGAEVGVCDIFICADKLRKLKQGQGVIMRGLNQSRICIKSLNDLCNNHVN